MPYQGQLRTWWRMDTLHLMTSRTAWALFMTTGTNWKRKLTKGNRISMILSRLTSTLLMQAKLSLGWKRRSHLLEMLIMEKMKMPVKLFSRSMMLSCLTLKHLETPSRIWRRWLLLVVSKKLRSLTCLERSVSWLSMITLRNLLERFPWRKEMFWLFWTQITKIGGKLRWMTDKDLFLQLMWRKLILAWLLHNSNWSTVHLLVPEKPRLRNCTITSLSWDLRGGNDWKKLARLISLCVKLKSSQTGSEPRSNMPLFRMFLMIWNRLKWCRRSLMISKPIWRLMK